MTDGTEYQSDPETSKVRYESRPTSGASTPSRRRLPPPLPVRGGLRPPIDRNDSSTSHYSDELNRGQESAIGQGQEGQGYADVPPPAIAPAAQVYTDIPSTQEYTSPIGQTPTDGPPGYEHHDSSGNYPAEKTGHTNEPAPYTEHSIGASSTQSPVAQVSAAQTEGMTEGERLEWEQYYADQQLAQQANRLDLNHGKEDESLR
jgi:hypothetical protein